LGDFDNSDDFWPRVQAVLQAELGEHRYRMWIAPLRLHSADGARVVLKCPTAFLSDNVKERFAARISALIAQFTQRARALEFITDRPAVLPRDPQPLFDASEPAPDTATAERRITVDMIKRQAVIWYKLQQGDLESRSRRREVVRPRQIATFVARQLTGQSYPQIARRFGPRDHTTILHGCQLVEKKMASDASFAAEVEAFMRSIREGNPG
jgi:chromosomal replication initiator protein